MASNPPGQCCTVGVKHEGEAKGEKKNIGDSKSDISAFAGRLWTLTFRAVETYFAYPKDKQTDTAILILTDVCSDPDF